MVIFHNGNGESLRISNLPPLSNIDMWRPYRWRVWPWGRDRLHMEYNVVTAELENAGSSLAHDKLGVGTTVLLDVLVVPSILDSVNPSTWICGIY